MRTIELHAKQLFEGIDGILPTTLAIGDFDGVHLGHQEVLRTAKRIADENSEHAAVMIFHPHPRVILGMDGYDYLLTPIHHRLNLFAKAGMQTTYIVVFDREFSEWSAEQFVSVALKTLQVKNVVVGFDFRYGFRGLGTVESLKEHTNGETNVHIVPPFELDGEKVSSRRIRALLQFGNVSDAMNCLGRPFAVRGTVVAGDARGRTIGFPTANVLPVEMYVVPKLGVYAATFKLLNRDGTSGESMQAVMNVGIRPTFEGTNDVRIEVHIMDRQLDLYGCRVEVEWIECIREEQKFDTLDDLIMQIRADVQKAKQIFSQRS